MRSLRQERSRLFDVVISLAAGLVVLAAVNARSLLGGAQALEIRLTGAARVTGSAWAGSAVDIVARYLRALEMYSYDQRLVLREQYNPRADDPKARDKLLFVEIDDQSLSRYGRWPWPRTRQAELIDTLKRLGCRGVLTDIEYPEPSDPVPGGVSPDEALARALARPSETATGRPAPAGASPDGAAFGVSYLELGESPAERIREQVRLRMVEWAAAAATGGASSTLPETLKRDLREASGEDGERRAATALAVARALIDQPTAAIVDLLIEGTLPDLKLPEYHPSQPGLRPPAPPLLIVTGALVAVMEFPDAPADELVRRTMRSALGPNTSAGPGHEDEYTVPAEGDPAFYRTYLPRLFAFLKQNRQRLQTLEVLKGDVFTAILERWIRLEQRLHPAQQTADLLAGLIGRMHLVGKDHPFARRVLTHRLALDLAWSRDLHPAPSAEVLARLPVFGRLNPPVPVIAAAYRGLGVSTVERDQGGVVRSQRLVFRVESGDTDPERDALPARLAFHASIPALAFLRELDLDHAEIGHDYLRLPARHGTSDVVIPIDDGCRTLIDFRGRWKEDGFARVNAAEILELSAKWRERDAQMSVDPVHAGIAAASRWLEAVPDPDLFVPVPGPAPFASAVRAGIGCAHAVAASWASGWVKRDTAIQLQNVTLNVVDYAEGLEEARKSGDKGEIQEITALLQQKRSVIDNLVMQLPLMESRLRGLVKGRFCLVGVTSTSTTDVSATPMQEQYVNIGVHANLIDQGLRGDYLFRPPWTRVDLPVLLAYLWIIPLILPLISIRKGAFAVALLIGIHMAMSSYLLIFRGVWVDGTTPVIAMMVAFGFITIRRYLMEERQKSRIRSMFQTYLDPRVVEAMIVDESVFTEIGGTTREITAFFSDIAGFTTISELLDSDDLSAMLQEYLTPMTERILEHGGLRDKYIGDAIVGIFGAPYASTDHAAQACLAAIEQVDKLAALKREWEADGVGWYRKIRERGLDLSFRIGLNTGRAKVGNFGSRDAKNYTMIGDTVNLAARLEGANKAYGSRVLISESTYGAANTVIEARELDLLRVVGKLQPVKVYEVLGKRGQVDPSRQLLARRFAEALFLYRGRKFDEARKVFAELHVTFPDDPPTQAYLKRLDDAAYISTLGPEWDGAFVAKEK